MSDEVGALWFEQLLGMVKTVLWQCVREDTSDLVPLGSWRGDMVDPAGEGGRGGER